MQAVGNKSWRLQPTTHHRFVPVRPRLPVVAVKSESIGNRMFVFGQGFTGRYVSDRLKIEGWEVAGTCTSAIRKRELEELDLDAFIFDARESKLEGLPSLQNATHLLISIPPVPGIGDPLLSLHEDLRRTLSFGNLEWLCYLSTTSVYGDCGGALVSEDYPVNPRTESAKSRFEAEIGWLNLGRELGVSTYVFRLGGIYGPGRSALDTIIKQKSKSDKQIMRKSKLYTARIHVADIYQAIKASFKIPSLGETFNVVDDDPTPRAEVFAFAQSLIKRRWPNGEILDCDAQAESQIETVHGEKRVSNARLKDKLGVKLLYPTYKSGLGSILDYHVASLEKWQNCSWLRG